MLQIEALLGHDLPSSFEHDFRKASFELFRSEIQPVPGIKEVLDDLIGAERCEALKRKGVLG